MCLSYLCDFPLVTLEHMKSQKVGVTISLSDVLLRIRIMLSVCLVVTMEGALCHACVSPT